MNEQGILGPTGVGPLTKEVVIEVPCCLVCGEPTPCPDKQNPLCIKFFKNGVLWAAKQAYLDQHKD